MKHRWSEKTCSPDGHSSRRVCEREGCEIVCVSRNEIDERGLRRLSIRGRRSLSRPPHCVASHLQYLRAGSDALGIARALGFVRVERLD